MLIGSPLAGAVSAASFSKSVRQRGASPVRQSQRLLQGHLHGSRWLPPSRGHWSGCVKFRLCGNEPSVNWPRVPSNSATCSLASTTSTAKKREWAKTQVEKVVVGDHLTWAAGLSDAPRPLAVAHSAAVSRLFLVILVDHDLSRVFSGPRPGSRHRSRTIRSLSGSTWPLHAQWPLDDFVRLASCVADAPFFGRLGKQADRVPATVRPRS